MKHSCEKPIKLIDDLIYELSNENDIIMDTFLGSGVVAESAKSMNRRYIGMELDSNYFNIAKERIENTKVEEEEN